MAANITMSLPLETIAAIQSSAGGRLTTEVLTNVTPALIQAAKALPVTCTLRESDDNEPHPVRGTTVTENPRHASDPNPAGAKRSKRSLIPRKRIMEEVDVAGDTASTATTQSESWKAKIKVILRDQPHRKLKLDVGPSHTVKFVKAAISEIWDEFPAEDQSLMKGQLQLLPQYYPLKHFGLEDNDIIYLESCSGFVGRTQPGVAPINPKVPIFVSMTTGKKLSFDIPLSTTVPEMKRHIESAEGVPARIQPLMFNGAHLADGLYHGNQRRTLEMCGVKSGDTLWLVLELIGS